jgi:hypothetical protein
MVAGIRAFSSPHGHSYVVPLFIVANMFSWRVGLAAGKGLAVTIV